MPRKETTKTSVSEWTEDMRSAAVACENLPDDQKKRVFEVLQALIHAGEEFYREWQAALKDLEDGRDLVLSGFARRALRMDLLRLWTENNPMVRERLMQRLHDASVTKPREPVRSQQGSVSVELAGRSVARPDW